jgi:glycosyltransferase involved in cell wall biosynthesis
MVDPRRLKYTDCVYLHEAWTQSNIVMAELCRRAGVPYILMPHGAYESSIVDGVRGPRALRLSAERRIIKGAAAVHVFFESEAAVVQTVGPCRRFLVSPTGLASQPRWTWQGGGDYLAWFGRYDPHHKGLDILVDAVSQLPPARRPFVALRGYDYRGGRARIEQMISGARLDPWIQVGDEIRGNEKAEFLSRAKAYVHPSRWESHSIALLEVLAAGIPALVSESIHAAPLLRSRDAAVVVPSSSEGWTAALARLDEERLEGVGRNGRLLASSGLSWSALSPRYRTALEAVLGRCIT